MSHVTDIELEVNDLEALKSACEDLGLEFLEDQKNYKWYGTHVGDYPIPEGFTEKDMGKCDHAIGVKDNPNAYQVGVVKDRNGGGYKLLWDFWNGGYGLQEAIGNDAVRLRREYAARVATKKARRLGFRVSRKTDSKGRIQLAFVK